MIVRVAMPQDAAHMASLLNRIIAIGGTTAHEIPMSPEAVLDHYIAGAECITSVVAEANGRNVGWQSIGWSKGEAHIGSFVDPEIQAKGIGAAMFAKTLDLARAAGLEEIHASIRADNIPGLAYYKRIGFTDLSTDPDFALKDGRVVGRVNRVFTL